MNRKQKVMVEQIERRIEHLTERIDAADTGSYPLGSWDRAERKTLLWAIEVIESADARGQLRNPSWVIARERDVEPSDRVSRSGDDAPHPSGDDRFAIYSVSRSDVHHGSPDEGRRRIAETSLDGIGLCISTLREDGEIDGDTRIGIFDREARTWIVNPWAKGVGTPRQRGTA